jgi:phage-related protein
MATVGSGVYEIRIHTDVEHRVLYVAKFSDGVYVLHAFEKKTQRTRQHDLDIAKQRLGELVQERRQARNSIHRRKSK